jgi:predicted RNase H-like HicB family nuclease
MRKFTFPVLIEEDEDGFYAECPALEGCATQGDTYEEAMNNIKEAIQLYIEALEADREKIPEPVSLLGLPMVEVLI